MMFSDNQNGLRIPVIVITRTGDRDHAAPWGRRVPSVQHGVALVVTTDGCSASFLRVGHSPCGHQSRPYPRRSRLRAPGSTGGSTPVAGPFPASWRAKHNPLADRVGRDAAAVSFLPVRRWSAQSGRNMIRSAGRQWSSGSLDERGLISVSWHSDAVAFDGRAIRIRLMAAIGHSLPIDRLAGVSDTAHGVVEVIDQQHHFSAVLSCPTPKSLEAADLSPSPGTVTARWPS